MFLHQASKCIFITSCQKHKHSYYHPIPENPLPSKTHPTINQPSPLRQRIHRCRPVRPSRPTTSRGGGVKRRSMMAFPDPKAPFRSFSRFDALNSSLHVVTFRRPFCRVFFSKISMCFYTKNSRVFYKTKSAEKKFVIF